MANTIKVKTDTLQTAARRLSRAAGDLEALCSSLPVLHDRRLGAARAQLSACKNKGRVVSSRIRRTSNSVVVAAGVLANCERRQITKARAVGTTGAQVPGGGGGGGGLGGDDIPTVPALPKFSDLIFDAVGGFGIAGGLIGPLTKYGFEPSAKNLVKMLAKGGKSVAKWAEFKKHTRYSVRNKKLLGLQPFLKNPSQATKWGLRFKRNFSKGFQKGWWDTGKSAAAKAGNVFTWGAALVNSAIDNFNEYKDGKISADRAVVEGAVETVSTVAVGAAASALVVALAPALPGVAVAVVGAGVVWGANYLTKLVTGKGVVEGVGYLAGEAYDLAKEGAKAIGKGAVQVAKGAAELAKKTGAAVADGAKTVAKWAKNLIRLPRFSFSW